MNIKRLLFTIKVNTSKNEKKKFEFNRWKTSQKLLSANIILFFILKKSYLIINKTL